MAKRMQKHATPTREQMEQLRRDGLDPTEWLVLKDLPHSLIVLSRNGMDCRVVQKK